MGRIQRKGGLFDNQVVRREFEVVVRSEPEIIILILGRCIEPAPLLPAERPLFRVAGNDVLSKFRADCLEQITEMADDRKVAQDGMLTLRQVVDNHRDHETNNDGDKRDHQSTFYCAKPLSPKNCRSTSS